MIAAAFSQTGGIGGYGLLMFVLMIVIFGTILWAMSR